MKKEVNKIRATAALLSMLMLGSTGCAQKNYTKEANAGSNTNISSNFEVSVEKNYKIILGNRELTLNDEQYEELVSAVLKNEQFYNRTATIQDEEHVKIERLYNFNVFGENFALNEKDYDLLVEQLLRYGLVDMVKSAENSENVDNENPENVDEFDAYELLTTEKFNNLVSSIEEKFAEINLAVKHEDIRKFAMIINIDKLAQDNKELIYEIIGNQNTDEVFADADKVIEKIMTYNYEYYYNDEDAIIKAFEDGVAYKHDVDGFVKLSDFIFDVEQREIVVEIESRISNINDSVRDNEKMNELIYKLLKDMIGSTSKLSMLEDGVNYAVEWLYIELVRGLFGRDLNGKSTLNPTNEDLVKYYVTYAGDEKSYSDNSSVNGSTKNINDLLNDCKTKTLVK